MKKSAPKRVVGGAGCRPPFAYPITKFGLLLLWLAPFCSCQPDSLSLQHGRVLEALTDVPSRIGDFDAARSTLTLLNSLLSLLITVPLDQEYTSFEGIVCVCTLSNISCKVDAQSRNLASLERNLGKSSVLFPNQARSVLCFCRKT